MRRILLIVMLCLAVPALAATTKMSAYKKLSGEVDDTPRIKRAILNAEKTGVLEFDQNITYKISSELDVTKVFVIRGVSKRLTVIEQTTPNTPVLVSISKPPFERHSYQWNNLTLSNSNKPTALTPKQYGIMFKAGALGSDREGNGVYYSSFSDLRLHYQYIGMGNFTIEQGITPFWGNYIERVEATGIAFSGFYFHNGGAIGQPYNRFRDIALNGVWVEQAPGAVAFSGVGLGNLILESFGVEDWKGKICALSGGGVYTITSVNTERVQYDWTMRLFDLADGHFELKNIAIEKSTPGECHSIISLYGPNTTANISGVFGPATFKKIHVEAGAKAQLADTEKETIGQ